MTRLPCVICGEPADQFTLHYTDGREHQRALIEPVQEVIKKMKEKRKCQQ